MGRGGEKWGLSTMLVYSYFTFVMFVGEYSHSLDTKGRLAIPKLFRSDLLDGLVITRGIDDCLFLYTKKAWSTVSDYISQLPFSKAHVRGFARLMLAGATNLTLDKQGRVLLPEYLRIYAHLEKEVVVAGLCNRIEIWNKKDWEVALDNVLTDKHKIAEQLDTLGL